LLYERGALAGDVALAAEIGDDLLRVKGEAAVVFAYLDEFVSIGKCDAHIGVCLIESAVGDGIGAKAKESLRGWIFRQSRKTGADGRAAEVAEEFVIHGSSGHPICL
jgi:hypothetical protein